MIHFESKTALAEHFRELEKAGYVKGQWFQETDRKVDPPQTHGQKYFKINFDKITKQNKCNITNRRECNT